MSRPAPTPICLPKRRCIRCGDYKAPEAGSRRVLRNGARSQSGDVGFVCAECSEKRT